MVSQNLDNLITECLKDSNVSKDLLLNIFQNTCEGIVFTDEKGFILFSNSVAKLLFNKKIENINEIGYLFNFDICILDNETDIITYSPISIVLENNIQTTIETSYENEEGLEKSITITGKFLPEVGYMFSFSDNTSKNLTQDYAQLTLANKKLTEKIKENEQLRSQAQAQAVRESLVNSISNAIRNSLEIDTILQTAVEELGKTLGTYQTILLQVSKEDNELPITHEFTTNKEGKLKGTTIKVEEDYYLQEVFETHEATTGSQADNKDKKNKFKLIVPVIHHDELFGMLVLMRANRKWHSEEINLVQSIADQISVSIKNAQLFEDTTSKNTKISVLNEILKSINASLILDDVFYTIGREIKRLINFDRASIAILDEYTNKVKLFARLKQTGDVEILRSGPLIAKGTAISWAIENLKPIRINMANNKDFADAMTLRKSGIKTAIIIPMINKGNVTGIFYVGSNMDDIYTDEEVEIMSQIAGQIAVAVENAKLYWQTQTQALKETLINQIVTSIRKSLILTDVLEATINEIGNALGVNNGLIWYHLEDELEYSTYEYTAKGIESVSDYFKSFFSNQYLNYDDEYRDIKIYKFSDKNLPGCVQAFMNSKEIKSLLLLPIVYNDPISNQEIKVASIILMHSDITREWTSEDVSLLKVLSDQITITINQARFLEQIQHQKAKIEEALLKVKQAQAQLVQSEKMAALGQLVAGVAHEINTPIGSISSNNSIFNKCTGKLKEVLAGETPNTNKANQLLQMLEETIKFNTIACERINDIVKSLKNFARLDESDLKRVDIHEGINSTLTLLRHELKDRIKIITNFSNIAQIECYPNLLNQVFMNLLVNAYQSIENKGTITITTKETSNKASISITDTGSGISEKDLSKIFDPGFTTKGVGVGTGLGLSICFQIIEKHKGKILVESQEGIGTTFTIIIPKKH